MSLDERWLPVSGHPEYEVSDLGRVKRVTSGQGTVAARPFLAPRRRGVGVGRVGVTLHGNGKKTTYYIHRLVMTTFVGPVPDGHEVNHIDGDPSNNRLTNLEYVTRSENVRHALRTGLKIPLTGEDHGRSKLTESDVRAIRRRSGLGTTHQTIAIEYGVARSTITDLVGGKTWACVPLEVV